MNGDVIGCLLDLDSREVSFSCVLSVPTCSPLCDSAHYCLCVCGNCSKNGKNLGVAFGLPDSVRHTFNRTALCRFMHCCAFLAARPVLPCDVHEEWRDGGQLWRDTLPVPSLWFHRWAELFKCPLPMLAICFWIHCHVKKDPQCAVRLLIPPAQVLS